MSPFSRTRVRRVAAAAALPLVLILSACGVKQDFTISQDDTVDFSYAIWDDSGSGSITESSCSDSANSSSVPSGVTLTYTYSENAQGDPTCTMRAANVPLSEFDGSEQGLPTITHEDDTYVFTQDVSDMAQADSVPLGSFDASASVTFPGKASEASGNGTIDGNKVSWSDVTSETSSLRAVGADGGTNPLMWIAVGVLVLLLIIGGALLAFFLLRRRRKAAGAGGPVPYGAQYGAQFPGQQAPAVPAAPQQGGAPGQYSAAPPQYQPAPGQYQPAPGQQPQGEQIPGPQQPSQTGYPQSGLTAPSAPGAGAPSAQSSANPSDPAGSASDSPTRPVPEQNGEQPSTSDERFRPKDGGYGA